MYRNLMTVIRQVCLVGALFGIADVYADTWYDPDTGYTWRYRIYGDTAEISYDYDSYVVAISPVPTDAVTIPSMLGGKPVTSIGSDAFLGCGLTSVRIPNSVTSIGSYAFQYCDLTNVTIGTGVTSIGYAAFSYCSRLTSVTIPDSVTSIGYGAFDHCIGLTSVTIPDSVTSIGDSAFYYCRGLTNLTIGTSVRSIGDRVFSGCSGLTSVTIPNSVTSIGRDAFSGCSGLTSVTIPNSVTNIASGAFSYCSGLTNLTIGTGVTNIDDSVFRDCSGLKTITVSAGNPAYASVDGLLLTKDGTTLIRGVNGDVTIPTCVTSIGGMAFYDCNGLTNVTIPNSVTNIGSGAFSGCSGLTNLTIGTGVRSISDRAFYDCNGLTSVTIPNGVTSIEQSAFSGCSSLTNLTIGTGVMSIKQSAFSGCSGLTSVAIPNSVTSIEGGAFSNCSGLMAITVSSDNSAYMSVGGLLLTKDGTTLIQGVNGDVMIPDCVTSIGDYAFYYCGGLTSVTIGNGVTNIGDYAFYYCDGLTSVTIGNGVTSIGEWAFFNCSVLTRMTIPDSVTSIGNYAFVNCGLTSVMIPDSVTSIGERVFSNCRGLTSATIPNSVTSIGDYAFEGSGLASVTIPDSVTSIGWYAFERCENLRHVEAPVRLRGQFEDHDVFASCPADLEVVYSFLGDIASESIVKTCTPDLFVYSGAANRPAVLVKDMERPPDLNVAAYAPGDVDGDGLLSTNDVLMVQRYNAYQTLSDEMKERFSSYNLTGSALAAADVNGDGVVNADDVTVLVGKFDGYEMVEGTDYTLAYSDNVNAGTGSVTITGIGNYTGTAALSFTIAEATIGADGEPGGGTVSAGGISKYDTACVYDGLPHTVDTNALAALRIGGIAPTIAYSPDGIGGWQAEPLVFTNACTTSIWYRLQVPNYAAYLHEARLTIEPKPIDDETVVKTFSYDSASGTGPEFSFKDPDVFRWQFVASHSAGDVDGDGVLTDGDVERIDQYLGYLELDESIKPLFEEFNLTGSALAAADYNGDGVVDDSDADELEASFSTLAEGVDYDVDVGYNVVTVTGIGNYAGIVREVFRSAEIRNVTAKQRWPWNGKVDITYEVMGDIAAGLPPDRMPGLLLLSATNHVAGTNYVADTGCVSGDMGMAEGVHHVVWDLNAQGLAFKSEDVVFTVSYTDEPKPYCVIDLSGGANASSYPVSYLADVPSGGWTDEYKTMKLVLRMIEPGSFMMGGQYEVTLTKPFYCGVFEVTQKQYELVTGNNPSYFRGDTLPVEKVSWNSIRGDTYTYNWPSSVNVDSSSFVGKLQARTGLNLDLPTDAQWEYACRAGTTTTYYWGNSMDDGYCWCRDNSSSTTHPVGMKTPNAWGLYDMSGNAWEWCLDWYGGLSSGVTDPTGSSSGRDGRVIRSGSWNTSADGCTSSSRTG